MITHSSLPPNYERLYFLRNKDALPFTSIWVQRPGFGGVGVAHLFSFLCYVF